MKQVFLYGLIVLMGLNAKSQSNNEGNKNRSVIEEVKWFIEKVDSKYTIYESTNNQYIVYVLYVYKDPEYFDDFCFTMGYIMNSHDAKYILPSHYFKIDDNYILVRFGENIDPSNLKNINLLKFNTYKSDAVKIIQKLFPSDIGGFTYQSSGIVFCENEEKSIHKYYENADEIPMAKSIWEHFPKGSMIELKRKDR